MIPRRVLFALGLLCLLATQAEAQTFKPVTSPDSAIQGFGFTVLPPGGSDWFFAVDSGSATVAFGKKDAEHARQRGSVFLAVTLMKARTGDLAKPDDLRAEIERTIRASSARFKLTDLRLDPYADAENATDCVRISAASQEQDNPNRPGDVLAMNVSGKACRHPLSPGYYVQATLSERRPVQSQPLVNDKLKDETDRAMGSVKFGPIP